MRRGISMWDAVNLALNGSSGVDDASCSPYEFHGNVAESILKRLDRFLSTQALSGGHYSKLSSL